ncbi:MAG TPA: cyclic peptide export ABC transporter [Thermoanaerobaculia bacterium]
MKLISFMLRSSRKMMVWAVVTGALSGIAGAGLIGVINSALAAQHDGITPQMVAAFATLFLLSPLTRYASEILLLRLAQRSVYQLRMHLARRILATPLRRLERMGAARLLVALTDDITSISAALADLPIVLVNGTIIVGCFIYMGWLSPSLLLLSIAFLIIGGGSYRLAIRSGIKRLRQARETQDTLYGHFRGMTEGAKELKLHGERRRAFFGLLEVTATQLRRLIVSARTHFSLAGNWGVALFFLVIGLLLFLPQMSHETTEAKTGFTLILLFIRGPLQLVLNMATQIGQGNVALEKIEKLGLTLPPEPSESGDPEPARPGWQRLDLVGVCHAYEREGEETSFTLGPIDVTLRPGELVFLVGGNGSGKTTLAKLLTGLYLPEAGDILLNGERVTDERREHYRQHFAAVFSEFHLFDSLLGIETPDLDAQARRYLSELHLAHKVKVKEGALSTTDLSRGQRKRLALLTAYLEDRPLYVFDEWAADQDPQFKEIFYHHLLPDLKARGKAVVVISHDDRYFPVADRILRLEDGRLIAIEELRPHEPVEPIEALA